MLINIFICIYSLSVKLVIRENDNDECAAAVQYKLGLLRRFPRTNQTKAFQFTVWDEINLENGMTVSCDMVTANNQVIEKVKRQFLPSKR